MFTVDVCVHHFQVKWTGITWIIYLRKPSLSHISSGILGVFEVPDKAISLTHFLKLGQI